MNPKIYFLCFVCFLGLPATAQLNDSFSDGDFLLDPEWRGDTSDFIINNEGRLQSNKLVAASTFYLSTESNLNTETTWEFWININFNPSSANYVDVWLTSQKGNLADKNNAGYFVRIGSTDDDICLFKKTPNASAEKIIDGVDGLLNRSSSTLKIRVIHAANKFILLRDMSATGNSYRSEGEYFNPEIFTAGYFGILIKQSTSSFFQKHFFDDFVIKKFEPGPTSFTALNVQATSPQSIDIQFNHPLELISASTAQNYYCNGGGFAQTAEVDENDGSIVHLFFSSPFKSGEKDLLLVDNVKDILGNSIHSEQYPFSFYKPQRYDVVINEVFADPLPQIGLPLQKFIELKNNASFPVNLKDWKISDGNSLSQLPSINLMPDSFLIICPTAGLEEYKKLGRTISISNFPSLLVSGGKVILYENEFATIHAVAYDLNSYKNDIKKAGGFSLEMIHSKSPCAFADNWTASNDKSGGTPGRKNSVDDASFEPAPLTIENAFLSKGNELVARLNNGVDSASALQVSNFQINPAIQILKSEAVAPFFNTVLLYLKKFVDSGTVYELTIGQLSDCSGKVIGPENKIKFGIASAAMKSDLVINEILFNPKADGVDYVELYNNSEKIIDLSRIYISNRNSTGALNSIQQLSAEKKLLFPSEYLLITTNSKVVQAQYLTENPKAFLEIPTMPSFPDESGTVVILDQDTNIIDEVNYNSKWHFPLVKDAEGVSLERLRFDGLSDKSNFHSAASAAGFGTPGYKNSQSINETIEKEAVTVFPKIFSPDQDGIDDFLTIQYQYDAPGFVTNVKIFDANGRLVRYLEKNSLSGLKGFFRWDGLDDKNQKLPQGIYILYIESFDQNGSKKIYKKTVVLARRY